MLYKLSWRGGRLLWKSFTLYKKQKVQEIPNSSTFNKAPLLAENCARSELSGTLNSVSSTTPSLARPWSLSPTSTRALLPVCSKSSPRVRASSRSRQLRLTASSLQRTRSTCWLPCRPATRPSRSWWAWSKALPASWPVPWQLFATRKKLPPPKARETLSNHTFNLIAA